VATPIGIGWRVQRTTDTRRRKPFWRRRRWDVIAHFPESTLREGRNQLPGTLRSTGTLGGNFDFFGMSRSDSNLPALRALVFLLPKRCARRPQRRPDRKVRMSLSGRRVRDGLRLVWRFPDVAIVCSEKATPAFCSTSRIGARRLFVQRGWCAEKFFDHFGRGQWNVRPSRSSSVAQSSRARTRSILLTQPRQYGRDTGSYDSYEAREE